MHSNLSFQLVWNLSSITFNKKGWRVIFKKDSEQVGMTEERKGNKMKRRDFLRLFLLGGIFSLFSKKVKAEKKPENKLKEAMFWKRLD